VAPSALPRRLAQLTHNALVFLREFGLRGFVQELLYRLVNHYYERRLGVETGGMVELPALGIHNNDSIEYVPIGYVALYRALDRIPLPAHGISFLDYGCGKGRALVIAGTFPFRKIAGVEISEQLAEAARSNIQKMRRRRAQIIEITNSDAVDFRVPDDANLIHFFNPFVGKSLEIVIGNILASHAANPRTIYIIYFNKVHFERIINDKGYRSIRPIHSSHFYPNYSCGIYELAQSPRTGSDGQRGGA
jgi:SAM-dependent methyltransferase